LFEVPDRLSPIESIIWRVGDDPDLRMTIGNLMVLDHAPSRADLTDRLTALSKDAPQLQARPKQSVIPGRGFLWANDQDFDAGLHLRQATVPAPGDLREVLDIMSLIEAMPFEPDRSPWDATLVSGLAGGKAALYLRAHHVLTDGMGGAAIVDQIFDEARQPAKAITTDKAPSAQPGEKSSEKPITAEQQSEGGRRSLTVTVDFNSLNRLNRAAVQPLTSTVNNAVNTANTAVNTALALDPAGLAVRAFQNSLDVASSVSRQALVTGGPLATWPDARSLTSRFEVISIPGARSAALALGGSRNTLLVAAVANALGLYLERQGQTCPDLRLATPTSLRHKRDTGGNWFAPLRIEVPTAPGHAGPQFGVVGERLARARNEPALRVTSALAMTIGRLPARLLIPALHAQAETVDFAATTVPGSRARQHVCGAAVEESYPFGPRLGCPVNLSALGNEDRLDIGIALDPSAITDPESLLECLRTAFAGFTSTPGHHRASHKESPEPAVAT
jgi:diacylglycerol O-acyltransferase / wax synthase